MFCKPLMDTVVDFKGQLTLNRHKLLISMEKIQQEYLSFQKKRLIDHQFVQYVNIDTYIHSVYGLFTPSDSEREREKDQRKNGKRSKNKQPTSKKFVAFSFAFGWYQWALRLVYTDRL